jgi:hypothetical protein
MKRTLRLVLYFVSIVAGLFFLARHTTLFDGLKNIFKPAPVLVDETPLLVAQIKNIAQLMTVEAYNEVVVDSIRYPFGIPPRVFKAIPGNPLAFFGASQLVLIVRGKVVAGVDLQKLDTSNIRLKGDSLLIQLPRAAVLDVITNPSDVETFIEQGDWDQPAATALTLQARDRMVQQAVAQGALQQADARARHLVHELFKNAGYKNVFVITALQVTAPSGKQ